MTKQSIATAIAAVALVSTTASFAQVAKPMMHKPLHHTLPAAKAVYVCKTCREYFSPTAAKKIGYKDGMGHKLTKMSQAPAGFMDGAKSAM